MYRSLVLCSLLLASSLAAAPPTFTPRAEDLIMPLTAASRVLVPAAGSVAGANGTYFRSDISIVNLRAVAQDVQLRWLPQGTSGAALAPVTIRLNASSGLSSEDFVSTFLQRTGLGAIEITGVTAEGAHDADALLHVAGRIWTPEPDDGNGVDDEGTTSQTFPAIALPTPYSMAKSIVGVRRSEQYRLNVGVANPVNATQRFRVTVVVFSTPFETTTFEVELAAMSMTQVNIAGSSTGVVQVVIENLTGTGGSWQAWASSIDNESGDAWSQMAFPYGQ